MQIQNSTFFVSYYKFGFRTPQYNSVRSDTEELFAYS